jgi:hypothetical protein
MDQETNTAMTNTVQTPNVAPPEPAYISAVNQQPTPQTMTVGADTNTSTDQTKCVDGQDHVWARDYTTCGICWAVWCFPFGLVCCHLGADKKCVKCQAPKPKS